MNNIFRQINRLHNVYESTFNNLSKTSNLNKSYCDYLILIYENPGISQNDLVSILKSDKTTVSKALKILETQGYISREKDSEDKRSLRIFPMKEHIGEIEEVLGFENRITTDLSNMDILSESEETMLHSLLARVERALEGFMEDSISKAVKGVVRKATVSDYININHLIMDLKTTIKLDEISDNKIFVYDVSGVVKGLVKLKERENPKEGIFYYPVENIYVDIIYVDKENRGFGIGKKIIDFIESYYKYENLKSIKVQALKEDFQLQHLLNKNNFIFSGSLDAVYFYEKRLS